MTRNRRWKDTRVVLVAPHPDHLNPSGSTSNTITEHDWGRDLMVKMVEIPDAPPLCEVLAQPRKIFLVSSGGTAPPCTRLIVQRFMERHGHYSGVSNPVLPSRGLRPNSGFGVAAAPYPVSSIAAAPELQTFTDSKSLTDR